MEKNKYFKKRYLALTIIPFLWALSQFSPEEAPVFEHDEVVNNNKENGQRPIRKIASIKESDSIKNTIDRSQIKSVTDQDDTPPIDDSYQPEIEEKPLVSASSGYTQTTSSKNKRRSPSASPPARAIAHNNRDSSTPEVSANPTQGSGFYGDSTYIHNVTNPTDNNGDANSDVVNQLSCHSTVPSGTYAYSLAVKINCSSAAAIRYCLAENSCCDPDSSMGQTYHPSSPLIIGMSNSNYCLSYYAIGNSGQNSEIASNRYLINRQAPDLEVVRSIIQAQTTEPPMKSYISSNDFGKNNFSITQMSYLTHNIGDSGDQLGCSELESQMSAYSAPNPLFTLNTQSITSRAPGSEIIIPLLPQIALDYGTNYIATLVTDFTGATPNYACTVSSFVLRDFEIFDDSAITSSGGLSGGFSSFGFYEDNFVTRAPAGESSSMVSQQKIETNFFSVLY